MKSNPTKILVAKYSPQNRCFCDDGEILVPANILEKNKLKLPKDSWFFIGIESGKPSRYGWVSELPDINITELVAKHLKYYASNATDEQISLENQNILDYLQSVAKEEIGTPMTASFFSRGVITPNMKLKTHRVIFHEEK